MRAPCLRNGKREKDAGNTHPNPLIFPRIQLPIQTENAKIDLLAFPSPWSSHVGVSWVMGVPQTLSSILDWDFPEHKPSILWYPHLWKPPCVLIHVFFVLAHLGPTFPSMIAATAHRCLESPLWLFLQCQCPGHTTSAHQKRPPEATATPEATLGEFVAG